MGVFVFPTGGGGGGDLPWQTVDLSSGWSSATDPDGIISSASTASGLTSGEYNAISSASTAYTMASNASDLKVWRVSRALQFGGANLTGSDSVIIALEIDCSTSHSTDGATQIGLMLCKDPTSTTRATAAMCGIVEQHTTGSPPDFTAISPTGAGGVLGNVNNEICRAAFMVHSGKVTQIDPVVTGNSNTYGPNGGRSAGVTFGSSDVLHLAVIAGTRASNTIAASDTATAKLRWAVTRLGS